MRKFFSVPLKPVRKGCLSRVGCVDGCVCMLTRRDRYVAELHLSSPIFHAEYINIILCLDGDQLPLFTVNISSLKFSWVSEVKLSCWLMGI